MIRGGKALMRGASMSFRNAGREWGNKPRVLPSCSALMPLDGTRNNAEAAHHVADLDIPKLWVVGSIPIARSKSSNDSAEMPPRGLRCEGPPTAQSGQSS